MDLQARAAIRPWVLRSRIVRKRASIPLQSLSPRLVQRAIRQLSTAVEAPVRQNFQTNEIRTGLLDLARSGLVNESRVALAVRSIDQHDAPLRVGILYDRNVSSSQSDQPLYAAKLLAAFLADAFTAKKPQWEQTVQQWGQSNSKGASLITRYASQESPPTSTNSTALFLLACPSPFLENYNIEIILAPVPSPLAFGKQWPVLRFAGKDVGSATTLPVHKTISVSETPAETADETVVIAIPVSSSVTSRETSSALFPVNADAALAGIDLIREAPSNIGAYQEQWAKSGIQDLLNWITDSKVSSSAAQLRSGARALIKSILTEATASITALEATLSSSPANLDFINTQLSQSLEADIVQWSQESHLELQNGLSDAFELHRSPWRRQLRWNRLFWHADDVSMITGDIIEKNFLVDAERQLVYLSGKLEGATANPPRKPTHASVAETNVRLADRRAQSERAFEVMESEIPLSYPTTILTLRQNYHSITIPALVTMSQTLTLQCLSTSFFSTLLSGLLYISSPLGIDHSTAIGIGIAGILWSMRRLQKAWNSEKIRFEENLRESGRQAIVGGERWIWGCIKSGQGEETKLVQDQIQKGKVDVRKIQEALESVSR